MDRRSALVLLAALPVEARTASKPARIAYLSWRPGPNEFEQSLLRGLAEFGWREDDNLRIDFRFAGFNEQRAESDGAAAARSQPDVVVVADRWIGRTNLRRHFPTTPVVAPAFGDPVASGWTTNLAHPDGNATGSAVFYIELSRKRLELLKEALPALQHAGALYNADLSDVPSGVAHSAAAGEALGVRVTPIPVRLPGGADAALAAAQRQGVTALSILSDTATITYREVIGGAALARRLPTIFSNRAYLRGGGLMSYGPDLEAAYRRAAYFVDRLLRGAKPADLPIEQLANLKLVVSTKVAQAIGVQLPRAMLLRADEVLE